MSTDRRPFSLFRTFGGLSLLLALASVLVWVATAPAAPAEESPAAIAAGSPGGLLTGSSGAFAPPPVSATLQQCVTSAIPAERSATFAGEMAAIPGAVKLQMRINVLERLPQENVFHAVTSPGLSVWRTAAPGVKTYRYLKEVTNLSAPAFYKAAVRFRWLNGKGKLMRSAELRTPRCEQTATGAHKGAEEPAASP
jgi:hypothetical protein